MIKRLFYFAAVAAPLFGCAGSPMGIATSPNAKEISIGGETYYVAQEGGVWTATHKDYLAKGVIVTGTGVLTRKMGLTRAIEAVSRCRVSDSTIDLMAIAMHASVKCELGQVTDSQQLARPADPSSAARCRWVTPTEWKCG